MVPTVACPVTPCEALRASTLVNISPLHAVRLLDHLRDPVGILHYSKHSGQAYLYWSRTFIRFHELRHPSAPCAAPPGLPADYEGAGKLPW